MRRPPSPQARPSAPDALDQVYSPTRQAKQHHRTTRLLLPMLVLGAALGIVPLPGLTTEAGAMTTETRRPTISVDRVDSTNSPTKPQTKAQAKPQSEADVAEATSILDHDEHVDLEAARTVAEADGRAHAVEETVEPFVMIGITVPSDVDGVAVARVHADDAWGEWFPLRTSPDHGPDSDTDEGRDAIDADETTEPVWIGDGDGYEVSLPGSTSDVEVHLVREGSERVSVAMASDPAGAAPTINSRSTWGARAPKRTISTTSELRLAVVHHSVNSNGYTAAQVPALLRSIQAYHMDAQGWDDIGYNFLVDRFGGTWEARDGGMDKVAAGGHSRGFNVGSTGVVVLGDFMQDSPPPAAVAAVGELLAWKFAIHGVNPAGTVSYYTSIGSSSLAPGTHVLPRINGHRDVSATACPGTWLYSQIGAIRSRAESRYTAYLPQQPEASTNTHGPGIVLEGDFNGDELDDVLRYRPGSAPDELWYGGPTGMVRSSTNVNGTYRPVVGDFDGDGFDDIFWYGQGPALDFVWYGGASGFTNVSVSVNGSYDPFVGDFDGDGRDDIFWYGEGSVLDFAWFGGSHRQFTSTRQSVNGVYEPMIGDFDGDGNDDIFWYGPGLTAEYIWYGSPDSGRFTSVRPTSMTGTYVPLVGDFDGNGSDDIFWYRPGPASDQLWLATGHRESFDHRRVAVNARYTPRVVDVAGDGADDIVWYAPGRAADHLWQFAPGGLYRSVPIIVSGTYGPLVGDFDGDGRQDILWLAASMSTSYLWLGQPDGLFGAISATS